MRSPGGWYGYVWGGVNIYMVGVTGFGWGCGCGFGCGGCRAWLGVGVVGALLSKGDADGREC